MSGEFILGRPVRVIQSDSSLDAEVKLKPLSELKQLISPEAETIALDIKFVPETRHLKHIMLDSERFSRLVTNEIKALRMSTQIELLAGEDAIFLEYDVIADRLTGRRIQALVTFVDVLPEEYGRGCFAVYSLELSGLLDRGPAL